MHQLQNQQNHQKEKPILTLLRPKRIYNWQLQNKVQVHLD